MLFFYLNAPEKYAYFILEWTSRNILDSLSTNQFLKPHFNGVRDENMNINDILLGFAIYSVSFIKKICFLREGCLVSAENAPEFYWEPKLISGFIKQNI